MKICVINGVNLNRLGFRDPELYGNESLDEIAAELTAHFPRVNFEFKTSNIEGEIVTFIQDAAVSREKASEPVAASRLQGGTGGAATSEASEPVEDVTPTDGIIINAGGYSHYSIAIRDAIADVKLPVVEVHLSNIFAREVFRRNSVISPVAHGVISGFGKNSYTLAVDAIIEILYARELAREAAAAELDMKARGGQADGRTGNAREE